MYPYNDVLVTDPAWLWVQAGDSHRKGMSHENCIAAAVHPPEELPYI